MVDRWMAVGPTIQYIPSNPHPPPLQFPSLSVYAMRCPVTAAALNLVNILAGFMALLPFPTPHYSCGSLWFNLLLSAISSPYTDIVRAVSSSISVS